MSAYGISGFLLEGIKGQINPGTKGTHSPNFEEVSNRFGRNSVLT
jgi:hypothetical protein